MSREDALYGDAAAQFGEAIERLARAYEADFDKRRDLIQEIHVALWRSLRLFDGRCSLRTWVYRVAHNTAITLVSRRRRKNPQLVTLDEIDVSSGEDAQDLQLDRRRSLDRLLAMIHRLTPFDRQIILLYLEGVDAAGIAEVTGLSPQNVATKVHRIKNLLARRLREGGSDVG